MSAAPLRLYTGPNDESADAEPAAPAQHQAMVTVPLDGVLPLLVEAFQSQQMWIQDFQHDEVTIPVDLYEILKTYQHCRALSAR